MSRICTCVWALSNLLPRRNRIESLPSNTSDLPCVSACVKIVYALKHSSSTYVCIYAYMYTYVYIYTREYLSSCGVVRAVPKLLLVSSLYLLPFLTFRCGSPCDSMGLCVHRYPLCEAFATNELLPAARWDRDACLSSRFSV